MMFDSHRSRLQQRRLQDLERGLVGHDFIELGNDLGPSGENVGCKFLRYDHTIPGVLAGAGVTQGIGMIF